MNKNHPFVFLPTGSVDKPSRIIKLEHLTNEYVYLEGAVGIFETGESYAFAYILSDIKPDEAGLWAYCPFHLGGEVFISKGKGFVCNACKKIIATNDFQLNACISSNPKEQFIPVPPICDSDLEILIERYRVGMNEVDVEYVKVLGKPYMAQGKEIQISPDTILPALKDGCIIIVKYVCPKCNDTGRCEPTLGEPDGKECICVLKDKNTFSDFRPEKPEKDAGLQFSNPKIQERLNRVSPETKRAVFEEMDEDEAIEHASTDYKEEIRDGFVLGARWMRGYNADKKFTLDDMKRAIAWGRGYEISKVSPNDIDYETNEFIQSLEKEKEQPKK